VPVIFVKMWRTEVSLKKQMLSSGCTCWHSHFCNHLFCFRCWCWWLQVKTVFCPLFAVRQRQSGQCRF